MSLNDGNKDGSSKPTAEYPGMKFDLHRAKKTVYRRGRTSTPRGTARGDTKTNAVDNNGTGTSSPRERSAVSHTRRDSTHKESDEGHRDSHEEHARAPSPVKSRSNTRPLSPSPLRDGSTVSSKAAERQSEGTGSVVSHRGRQMDNAYDGGGFSSRRQLSPGRFVESPVSSPRKGSIPALDDGADRGSGHNFRLPGPVVPLGTSLDSHPSVPSPLRKETPTSLITGKPVSTDAADKSHQRDRQNKGTAGQTKPRSVQSAPPPLPERPKPAPPPAPVSILKRPTSLPHGSTRFNEVFSDKNEDSMSPNVPTSALGAEKKEKRPIWERFGFEHAKDEETESQRQDRMKPHRAFKKSKYLETRSPKNRIETMLGSSDI
ncbi:hypothetical protein ACEPAI_1570 [Sanghuangporus weigelae]